MSSVVSAASRLVRIHAEVIEQSAMKTGVLLYKPRFFLFFLFLSPPRRGMINELVLLMS